MYYEHLDEDGWPTIGPNQVIAESEHCSNEVMSYNRSIRREFHDPEEMIAAGEWAEMCCTGPWVIGCVSSGFMRKEDLMHFKLVWA